MAETKLILETVVKGTQTAVSELGSVNRSLNDLSGTAQKAGLFLAGIATAGIGAITKLAQSAGQLEQVQIAFTTIFGSAEKAQSMLKDLAEFASKTPFTIPGIERAALQLKAVGFASDEILPTLKSVGDVAAGLGLGQDGLDRLILNLGQVKTQGKLTGRELRDFAVNGVPLIDELAKSMGVTKDKIVDMTSAGEILADDVITAFENMSGAGGQFEDLMFKLNDSLLGQWSNMKDSLTLLGRNLGEPLIEPLRKVTEVIIGIAQAIGKWVQDNPKIAELAATILLVVTAVAAIGAPMLLLVGFLPTIIAGFTALTSILGVIIGPIIAVGLAVVALVAIWKTNFLGIQDITRVLIAFLVEKFQALVDFILPTLEEIATIAKETWAKITEDWRAFMEVYGAQVIAGWELVKSFFGAAFEAIKFAFSLFWNALKFIFEAAWAIVSGVIKTALLLLQGDWKGAWEAIKGIFEGVWNAMKSFVKDAIDSILGFVDGLIEKVKSAIEAVKSLIGLGDGSSSSSSSSSKGKVKGAKAMGGPVVGASTYLVGEQGPELFTPKLSGMITPNNQLGGGGATFNINISGVFGSDAIDELGDALVHKVKLATGL